MKTVIILEGDTIQTLTAAKSLKNIGYRTVIFYESKTSYGYHTKYGDLKIKVPSISNNVKKFHQFFLHFLENNQVDAVIPMFDYSAEYLSKNKEVLKKYTNFHIPDYHVLMKGYDKNQFMAFCYENQFPHPATLFNLNVANAHEALNRTGFPAIIKPNITNGARGFKIVNNIQELVESIPNILNTYGDCHLQEYIPQGGKQYLVGIYTKDGKLINATVLEKKRFYPIKGGSSCFNQTIKNDKLIELCFNIQKSLKWNGYAHYDLIEDPRNGLFKVMELNPRIQGCIKSSNIAGVDFIENIIADTFNQPLRIYEYNPGSYLRYLGLDLLWLLKSKNRRSWFSTLFDKNHFLQDGSWDDPKPFIYGTIGGFLKQLNPNFRATKKGMN